MTMDGSINDGCPKENKAGKFIRAGLNIASITPYIGGAFSAISGAWSERNQEKVNNFFRHWLQMLEDEMTEKEKTMIEIMQRLDLGDEKIAKRVESSEFQSLVKKCFRDWSGVESEKKREYVRNIVANAAASNLSSDSVVRLFIDWINKYSELHFDVIACIYRYPNGISRGQIWNEIGKGKVREDSADADLYKLLIRDLNTGQIIRQHRQKDYYGNFLKQASTKKTTNTPSSNTYESAFDTDKLYVLTALGQDFIHYAMTDLPIKIEFKKTPVNSSTDEEEVGEIV